MLFRSALSLLNLPEMFLSGLVLLVLAQLLCTVSKKPSCSTQKLSNLKIFALGIFVLIAILHEIWSEVILAKGRTSVIGKFKVQLGDVKNQSSCSKSGFACMLLQV